jgi:hypothetical protein
LVGDNDFRGRQECLNYAEARYFCLYMQERAVLESFYRSLRQGHARDPLGLESVAKIFPDRSWDELDADFRDWVMRLKQP